MPVCSAPSICSDDAVWSFLLPLSLQQTYSAKRQTLARQDLSTQADFQAHISVSLAPYESCPSTTSHCYQSSLLPNHELSHRPFVLAHTFYSWKRCQPWPWTIEPHEDSCASHSFACLTDLNHSGLGQMWSSWCLLERTYFQVLSLSCIYVSESSYLWVKYGGQQLISALRWPPYEIGLSCLSIPSCCFHRKGVVLSRSWLPIDL